MGNFGATDTDNNRVLIWKTIPTIHRSAGRHRAGAKRFHDLQEPPALNSSSLRGPQGVWIQGTQLFVADTQNHRVMIWNPIPTSNNQPADLVLGEPNFSTAPPSTTSDLPPTASNLFSPVSVTSDGQHLYVTDLGHNRVLIWNSIPTQNGQAADVVVGQPNMTTKWTTVLSALAWRLARTPMDTLPSRRLPDLLPFRTTDSVARLSIRRAAVSPWNPRYALSDGHRLFIADGGNDRVLVYNSIPTTNGAKADIYLGQPDEFTDQVTTSTDTFRPDANILESAPNTFALLWRWRMTARISMSPILSISACWCSPQHAEHSHHWNYQRGEPAYVCRRHDQPGRNHTAGDTVTITITSPGASPPATTTSSTGVVTTSTTCPAGNECYTYTVVKTDTLVSIAESLANLINGTAKNPTRIPTSLPLPISWREVFSWSTSGSRASRV